MRATKEMSSCGRSPITGQVTSQHAWTEEQRKDEGEPGNDTDVHGIYSLKLSKNGCSFEKQYSLLHTSHQVLMWLRRSELEIFLLNKTSSNLFQN